MIEDYEGLSSLQNIENHDGISESQSAYIEEVLPLSDSSMLVDRIDEMSDRMPPKAIDSDKDIAEIISPIIDKVEVQYLEAPSDSIQIENASEMMSGIEGLEFEEWKEKSFEERVSILQIVEDRMSGIAHRPACVLIVTDDLREGEYGYFDTETGNIKMNGRYIASDSFADYKECLDTIVHEGRHAYQDYNLYTREVHPRGGDVTNWRINMMKYGYQDPRYCGFEAYEMQPVECDARAFAEDVLNSYFKKSA